jgi:hypothetical protein
MCRHFISLRIADGRQNLNMSSIFVIFILVLTEVLQNNTCVALHTICGYRKVIKRVTKSYLSPFSKLAKDKGAPHANSVKLGSDCMQYCMKQFAKRLK